MMAGDQRRVVRAGSEDAAALARAGWVVVARSWAAQLDVDDGHRGALIERATRVAAIVTVRELEADDAPKVLALDARTAGDYPGDVATRHEPLRREAAVPTSVHRGWGAFDADGRLVAVTFIVIEPEVVETDFTVVDAGWRGRGIGAAVKAASVLSLADEGRTRFRTGGGAGNAASVGANLALGYVVDEEWLTFAPGARR
ncbi:acetyltransferase [Cnuibacter sp. UC19_7]|uniref:acetyltransferase n=1 Tax=Cnuibacter sp. UC19_7 TaxID=3350166 RepID=UPI00366D9EE0